MPHRMRWSKCLLSAIVLGIGVGSADAAPSLNRQTPTVKAILRVRPSVVNIHSQKMAPIPEGVGGPLGASSQKMNGMGTGVVVDERGYLVTNYHVIEDVSSITATLADGQSFPAEVVARDPETDLALLRIRPKTPLPVMPLGTSDDLLHGETVIAIGNAFGYEHTITCGIISQLHRDVRLSAEQSYRDLIQTDASINPGNSGGPLVNLDGEMIGLNVAIRAGAQGIGFAIPVEEVKRVAGKLMSVRQLNNTWHGMICQSETSEPGKNRVVVERVEPGSPAQSAGIRAGDRLLFVGERQPTFAYDVERALLDKKARDQVPVVFSRGNREERVTMTLRSVAGESQDPGDFIRRRLGLRLAEGTIAPAVQGNSSQLRGGLRVLDVDQNSAAAQAGIQSGDLLVGLHQWETLSVENVVYVLSKHHREDMNPMRFYVVREGQVHRGFIHAPAGE